MKTKELVWLGFALREESEKAFAEAILKCKHSKSKVVEVNPTEYKFIENNEPPFRICKNCGYAEEGWGCGYWKLDYENVPLVKRDSIEFINEFNTQANLSSKRYINE